MTGPSKRTLETVWYRDLGLCAWCGKSISGSRGVDWSLHHRSPRGMGGRSEAWVNEPANLILLHGSGVIQDGRPSCHGVVEQEREKAMKLGFLVPRASGMKASDVPITHAVHGKVYLDGTGVRECGEGSAY